MIGHLEKTVIDCPGPRALATFCSQVLFTDLAGHPFCIVFGQPGLDLLAK